jgi:hypoxanthine phosphoribosyltransferase
MQVVDTGQGADGSSPYGMLPTLAPPMQAHEDDIEEVLIGEDAIQARLAELGERITADYAGRDLLLVGVLKGAFVVMADLSRYIRLPLEFDFMAVSSYGAATQTSGVVRILKDLDHEIEGRDVLIVEDIVDSGLTLSYLLKNLRTRRPASLEVFALMQKRETQRVPLEVRYRAFEIPPVFVVGYGLDFAERFRNLPFVGTLKPEVYRDAI